MDRESGKHTTLIISNPGDLLQGIGWPDVERLKAQEGNAEVTQRLKTVWSSFHHQGWREEREEVILPEPRTCWGGFKAAEGSSRRAWSHNWLWVAATGGASARAVPSPTFLPPLSPPEPPIIARHGPGWQGSLGNYVTVSRVLVRNVS